MKEAPTVTVVIPTHNRRRLLLRAIRSAQRQVVSPDEIIVVDDCSDDGTESMVSELRDERVRYLRLPRKGNGSVARNLGIEEARGDFIALLDSDDEWLPNHLKRKLEILMSSGKPGVFGSFFVFWSAGVVERTAAPFPESTSIADYVVSGNTHTSTLVLDSRFLKRVPFDPLLDKHQDWDFMIRFAARYSFAVDEESTVLVHPEVAGRMSFRMNHGSTEVFLERHRCHLGQRTLAHLYTLLAKRTLQSEGRNPEFAKYLSHALGLWRAADTRTKVTIAGLLVPGFDRAFLKLGSAVVQLHRRVKLARRPHHTLCARKWSGSAP